MFRKLSLFVAAVMASVSLSGNVALANGQPTLLPGDTLFEVSCDSSDNTHQLYQLDLENNARVAVGTGSGSTSGDCASQGAILPGSDWFYFIDLWNTGQPLVRVNLGSGAVEIISETNYLGQSANLHSLTIDSDGSAFALSDERLFAVNLTTGALTLIGDYDYGFESAGSPFAFAYDPTTDKFYVADSGMLSEIDVATGVATRIGYRGPSVASMAFDSGGALWLNGHGNYVSTTTIDGFSQWEQTSAFSPNVNSESLAIINLPESPEDDPEGLAATGADNLAMLGLAGALLVGTAVIVRRRRA